MAIVSSANDVGRKIYEKYLAVDTWVDGRNMKLNLKLEHLFLLVMQISTKDLELKYLDMS